MNDEEFERLYARIDHRTAGQGDSPYTQELLDEMNGKKKEEKRCA